jgi:hypothetical protein
VRGPQSKPSVRACRARRRVHRSDEQRRSAGAPRSDGRRSSSTYALGQVADGIEPRVVAARVEHLDRRPLPADDPAVLAIRLCG